MKLQERKSEDLYYNEKANLHYSVRQKWYTGWVVQYSVACYSSMMYDMQSIDYAL